MQAAGASPFYRSFRGGLPRGATGCEAETVATAIRIGDPASHDRAVRTIRETRGVVTAVTDREILEAKAVVDAAGIGCEPASAAAVAGVRRLVGEGVIRRADSVVAILTGHVLKDPGVVMDFHSRPGRPPQPARHDRAAPVGGGAPAASGAEGRPRPQPSGVRTGWRGRRRRRSRRRFAAGRAAAARVRASSGSASPKVLPLPSSDSTQICPPWPSTMSRQM